ncbi:MAG TPA: CHAT domain-containing protein, partial [Fibrobacteria bacterium]|nr:CHAT domain-containing protein [Fibrobacteria bacterium]
GQEGASDTLRALDAASMPLGGYALVSLSACETGKVGSTRANENLGFERAFLAAGANNLILSSWNVESDASRLWMDSFHRNAQRETLAEAARLALVDTKKAFPNPSAWAPYFLVGK